MKKVGVGISGDAHKLQTDFGVQCAGLVCLSEEANIRLCSMANGRMTQKWSLAGREILSLQCNFALVSGRTPVHAVLNGLLYSVFHSLLFYPQTVHSFIRLFTPLSL